MLKGDTALEIIAGDCLNAAQQVPAFGERHELHRRMGFYLYPPD